MITNRQEFFGSVDLNKRVLEISPAGNPIFHGIKYYGIIEDTVKLDYKGDLENVPPVFDIAIGSHVLEHMTDIVKHINEVGRILGNSGTYYLAFPDYRYCFDFFKRESTIFEVLEAHYLKRRVHAISSVLEYNTINTHNDPVSHWNGEHGKMELNAGKLLEAYNSLNNNYADCHGWQFTPQRMQEVLQLLNDIKLINCAFEVSETNRNTFEYFIKLNY